MNKNKRKNELFIGKENMYIEGRTIKHPALIDHYANVKADKTRKDMIKLIGTDIETNHLTGQMKLLGFTIFDNYDFTEQDLIDKNFTYTYTYETKNHLRYLAGIIKYAVKNDISFAFWNKLDANEILRLFILNEYSKEKEDRIIERFGSVGGEFNKRKQEWEVMPVCYYQTETFTVGIKQAIRSSLQFFYHDHISGHMEYTWAYDIAGLYPRSLEPEAGGRFEWYSKVDKSAHLVEWDRFETDKDYRENIVLKSNELDCLGASALGYLVMLQFKEAFTEFPASLISAGSLARSAVTVEIERTILKEEGANLTKDSDVVKERKYEDVKSIGLISTLDKWLEDGTDEKDVKDFYAMCTEAYSGGQIEALAYGYSKEGWYADIASAYPAVIQYLEDLRGSKLTKGIGKPKHFKNGYTIIRGKVTVPDGTISHPITIKHPRSVSDTNIRPAGMFYASYTIDERDYNESIGCTFEEESWYHVETTGVLSVMKTVVDNLIKLRKDFISKGSSTESLIKQIVNSLYGIQFEAVPMHEDIDDVPVKIGYRAGEFWNPLFATFITARTRIIISMATSEIEKAGGTPILQMTDSILWKGTKDMLPKTLSFKWGESGVKEIKTLGYFEPPEKVTDIVCFGTGRYGFEQEKYSTNKRRGLNISGVSNTFKFKYNINKNSYFIHSKAKEITSLFVNDIELDSKYYELKDGKVVLHTTLNNGDSILVNYMKDMFKWIYILEEMVKQDTLSINVDVRSLVSAGMLKTRNDYNAYDLGRIVEEIREVDVLSGQTKRVFDMDIKNPKELSKRIISTRPLYLNINTWIEDGYVDGTLPILRGLMSNKIMKSNKVKRKESRKVSNDKYNLKRDKEKNNEIRKQKYRLLKKAGLERTEAQKLQNRSWEDVIECLKQRKQHELLDNINV